MGIYKRISKYFRRRRPHKNAYRTKSVIISDARGHERFVPRGVRSLPSGVSFHRDLRYELRKTGWRVDVVESLENLGLTAEDLRTMKTKNGTPENTLKRALRYSEVV